MNEDLIKSEIEQAIAQVDNSLTIDNFAIDYNSTNRRLTVHFTATSADDKEMNIKVDY